MHNYSKYLLILSFTLATPLYTSRWQHAYKCNFNAISPHCCVDASKIIDLLDSQVCLVEDHSHGEPLRYSITIDDFPVCTVYRSGACIHDAEICVLLRPHIYICQTSFTLIFKNRIAEWCFSSYLKIYSIKMYKYPKLCGYFTENYFLLPRIVQDLLIDLGY
ncbi:uncharacterized protein LOC110118506 isoform X1 [Ceratitis capitata]|uniref:uncharacterized protein LOC110118506 isoform X1 n=1 Tax=Ceratitis capitata TaxID=7213 RepID=UPI000A1003DF|nr:uncharacterized protein LOC110118506 isoform X1 [Ceratitis capitata]XP_020715981.1 uncharacterized protein LOC110118506 isoform X1 [Ceratitis capitata]XP_020715982.1 uncharacterized protein LOC110118506 isoform X1 [Ceratitis capitata]XP_020715983.1 uncharacterized protein LOC110118506 isoform X1 [Ceratitis capitata]